MTMTMTREGSPPQKQQQQPIIMSIYAILFNKLTHLNSAILPLGFPEKCSGFDPE